MAKMKTAGKKVKGCDYAEAREKQIKKTYMAESKGMKTAGIANELKLAEKQEGYSKKTRVKPQKKNAKPVRGQRKID
jgi:hypothetical protein